MLGIPPEHREVAALAESPQTLLAGQGDGADLIAVVISQFLEAVDGGRFGRSALEWSLPGSP